MDKNKPIDNNPEELQLLNQNPDNKIISDPSKSENIQSLIPSEDIPIKENNISKNNFTGITPDMITVMPKNTPNLILEKESKNKNEINNDKDNNNDNLENNENKNNDKDINGANNENNENDINDKDNNDKDNNDKDNNKENNNENNNEKSKENILFEEEKVNIGDQATLYDKEQQNLNNNFDKKEKEDIYTNNKSFNSKENEEEKEKFENNTNNNNDINNISNNDSSNIQGNTIEDINKTNIKLINNSKKSSEKNLKNNNNSKMSENYIDNSALLNQLKKTFNDEINKLTNDFNSKINKKLNNINNRLLGISQNVGRIKSNLNLLKHTNNLKFRDSKVIIGEENEEQIEKSFESIITEKNIGNKNYDKYKSYNILWETISLYLKNENFEEAYIKALQGGDDIIFLRLIFSIGTQCLSFISVNTNKLILKHFNSIFRTFSIQNKFLEYLECFYNMDMLNVKYFSVEELNDLMQTLYEMKSYQNEVGIRAKTLYNYILKDFSSNNQ